MNKANQYPLVETSHKWPKNENDKDDNEYEVPILKYDANQDALVEKKEGTPMEEEEEPKTLSQSTFKEGENIESKDDESCASCS